MYQHLVASNSFGRNRTDNWSNFSPSSTLLSTLDHSFPLLLRPYCVKMSNVLARNLVSHWLLVSLPSLWSSPSVCDIDFLHYILEIVRQHSAIESTSIVQLVVFFFGKWNYKMRPAEGNVVLDVSKCVAVSSEIFTDLMGDFLIIF